mmetsp:Transcript_3358/g.7022  ORF Transcript_3358/g.7022 Transcript_3358/m.7022 type:complete len:252 (-) Transcript_3358:34-789(-)
MGACSSSSNSRAEELRIQIQSSRWKVKEREAAEKLAATAGTVEPQLPEQLPDHKRNLKCVIIGDSTVGKTSLLITYTTNEFPEETWGFFDIHTQPELVDGNPAYISLYDTAGNQDYDRLRPLSYPQTDVFLVCFSIASPDSLANIEQKWVPEITHHAPRVPFLLVGLKSDLRNHPKTIETLAQYGQKPVQYEEGQKLASELGALKYVEASSLEQEGVTEVFQEGVRSQYNRGTPLRVTPLDDRPEGRCAIS